jgi:hypothetical protein
MIPAIDGTEWTIERTTFGETIGLTEFAARGTRAR